MKSKFNQIFNVILQQLNDYQKQLTDNAIAKRKYFNFGPIFVQERTYFPVQQHNILELQIPTNIKVQLDKAGFYITDYRAGIAMKKAKPGQQKDLRQIKIGKILNRLNKPELSKEFNERLGTSKKNIKNITFQICITYNPYDIAGMSTDRNWTSCMQLPNKFGVHGGVYHKTALRQVQYGGMCAYLININDKNIQKPYARIAIKRFINKKDDTFIFVAENIIYGDEDLAKQLHMNDIVSDILNKSNNETKKSTYDFNTADKKSWSDNQVLSIIDSQNLSKQNINEIINKLKKLTNEQLYNNMIDYTHANIKLPLNFINAYIKFITLNPNRISSDVIKMLFINQQYPNDIFNKILNICNEWICYLIIRNLNVDYICKNYKLSKQQAFTILEKAKLKYASTSFLDKQTINNIIKNINNILN